MFFFKQKTAYEMRISDWSSDVCSSDLLLERRGDLVLDDLHPRRIADDIVAILDLAGAADVEPDGSIEFERVAAGGRFGIAVHHAHLHAELVEEDHHATRAADPDGELSQPLRHESRLEADMPVAHLALDLRARQGRPYRIDHDHGAPLRRS